MLQENEIRDIIKAEIESYIATHNVTRNLQRPSTPVNAGMPWTIVEDRNLARRLRKCLCELAKVHGRSFGSVAARIRRNELMYMSEAAEDDN